MERSKKKFFPDQIHGVHQRMDDLVQHAQAVPWQNPQLVVKALEELRTALEELHVAEEELRQQNDSLMAAHAQVEIEQARYQSLFEFAPDAYLVTTLEGVVEEANNAASRLLKLDLRYLLGKPLVNFVPPDQRQSFRAMLNHLPQIGRVQEWELQLINREHQPFAAVLTIDTVRHDNGEAIALRWMIRDITVRKQAEAQLQAIQLQNLQLVEADRLKNQFLATLSHELKTPLSAIIGFSELLLRQVDATTDLHQLAMVDCIFRNSKQLLALIDALLDFSTLTENQLKLQLEPFDLVKCMDMICDDLRSLANQKGLTLVLETRSSSILITTDATRLRQVMTNLIANAIKFTHSGSITVNVQELPESRVAIAIRDTGIGIDSEHQASIFQAFWQVNQTYSREYGGIGLGLAIVSALVQLMQGSISVESQVGIGSTFRVELPRQVDRHA